MSSIIAHYRSLIAHLGFISGVFATFPFKFNRFSYFELKTTVFFNPERYEWAQFQPSLGDM